MNTPVLFSTPETKAGVRKPGMMVLPQGVERHPVPGGGSRAVPIFAGDQITLQDVEGLQPIEMVFLGPTNDQMPRCWGPKAGAAQRG